VTLVVIFALACMAVMGVIGAPARVGAIALTLIYVLATGAGPSIVRAGAAGGLVSIAWLASRWLARCHLLACGAVVVLALNPLDRPWPVRRCGWRTFWPATCCGCRRSVRDLIYAGRVRAMRLAPNRPLGG
jgi:hypothetical protein